MKKLLTITSAVLILSSCGTVSQVPQPKTSFPVSFKQEKVPKKKEIKVKAELDGVPLSVAVKTLCRVKKLSCDLTNFDSQLPVTIYYDGSLYDFLRQLEVKTGYKFSLKDGVLTVQATSKALENERKYLLSQGERVSISAAGISLKDFISLLSQKLQNWSIVIGKGVDLNQKVTVVAVNKPVFEVLQQAVSSLGYEVKVNEREKTFEIVGWESKVIQLPSFFSNFKTATVSASSSVFGGTSGGSNTSSSLSMQFLQVMKSQFEETVRDILGAGMGRGVLGLSPTLSVNYDLLQLYVEGRPDKVEEVERYVEKLKKQLSKQVLIDVAVIEQRVDNSKTIGVDWTGILKRVGNAHRTVKITQSSLGATNGVLSIEVQGGDFSSVLKAIEKTGTARIITNFRLAVPNFDVATISSSVTRQFVTQIQREVNPTTGRETYTTTTQQVSEGSALFVRPIVRDDGKVDVVIAPSISSILGVDAQQLGDVTIQNPIVAQRNSPLRLVVKPDTTYVLGGIVSSTTSSSGSGVPYLSSLPLLGEAFGVNTKENKNSIIYVVLKTHVVKE